MIERVGPAHVRIRFRGAYRQPEVNWQADLMSLENYQSRRPEFTAQFGERTALMEVGELNADPRRLLVALPLAEITRREILQTVMMVRNYRAFTEGSRQWSG